MNTVLSLIVEYVTVGIEGRLCNLLLWIFVSMVDPSNKFSHFVFIWECINFHLIFKSSFV